jgi:hypothetical protein
MSLLEVDVRRDILDEVLATAWVKAARDTGEYGDSLGSKRTARWFACKGQVQVSKSFPSLVLASVVEEVSNG